MTKHIGTVTYPVRASLPTGVDGDTAIAGGLFWTKIGGGWVPANQAYANGTAATPNANMIYHKVYTATGQTDATGTVTFTMPASAFGALHAAVPSVVRNTTSPNLFAFAFVRTQSTTSVVVQVAEGKQSGVLIGGVVDGLEPAGAGVTVSLVCFGV